MNYFTRVIKSLAVIFHCDKVEKQNICSLENSERKIPLNEMLFGFAHMKLEHLVNRIVENAKDSLRYIVAVAGPPASGKTTLADRLRETINAQYENDPCIVVPMDGFHLDNEQLDKMGMRNVKGAPQTFDAEGFVRLIKQIRAGDQMVVIPQFDRSLDMVVAGDRAVTPDHRIVVVEGNYLLLKEPPWDGLNTLFDLSVMVSPKIDILEARLISRWIKHGMPKVDAIARALSNDIPNARYVLANSGSAEISIERITD